MGGSARKRKGKKKSKKSKKRTHSKKGGHTGAAKGAGASAGAKGSRKPKKLTAADRQKQQQDDAKDFINTVGGVGASGFCAVWCCGITRLPTCDCGADQKLLGDGAPGGEWNNVEHSGGGGERRCR